MSYYREERLPPLPREYEDLFYDTLEKVKGIAARVKEERAAATQPVETRILGDGGSFLGQSGSKSRITSYCLVPANRAGLVIGNRGETLKRIEKMAQVKLQFDQQWLSPNNEKRVQIIGLPEDVEEAIKLIKEKSREPDGKYPPIQISVPSHKVGLLIGKGGETIRELQERSGAKIMITPDGGQDQMTGERPIQISGDDASVQRAREMINDLVTHGTKPSMHGSSFAAGRNAQTIQIPESAVGAIIGKKAETLKSFQAMSNAKIFIEPTLQPGMTKRVIHISGSPECVAYAQQLIEDKVRQIEAANAMSQSGQYYDPTAAAGVIYQAPGEFSVTDPAAAAYDYTQYYQQYYQQYYNPMGDPQQAQQAYDYAAYAAQYAAQQQQQQQYPPPS